MKTPKNAVFEEEILSWDFAMPAPAPRASGTIPVKLEYKGRSKPFRLRAPQPKEHALQNQILAYLRRESRVSWVIRINSGSHKVGDRWIVNYRLYLRNRDPITKGVSDLLGMLKNGRLFCLEVKRPGEMPSSEQDDFINAVLAANGIAGVVYSWQDARDLLFGEYHDG